jgi:hypothetical protein
MDRNLPLEKKLIGSSWVVSVYKQIRLRSWPWATLDLFDRRNTNLSNRSRRSYLTA